jgi:hypothetical protein
MKGRLMRQRRDPSPHIDWHLHASCMLAFQKQRPRQSTPISDLRSATMWRVVKVPPMHNANTVALSDPVLAVADLKQTGRTNHFAKAKDSVRTFKMPFPACFGRPAMRCLSSVTLQWLGEAEFCCSCVKRMRLKGKRQQRHRLL